MRTYIMYSVVKCIYNTILCFKAESICDICNFD